MPAGWTVPSVGSALASTFIEEITIDLTQPVTDLSLISRLNNIRLITGFTVKQMDSLCTFKAGSTQASVITMQNVGEVRERLAFNDIFFTKLASLGSLVLEVHGVN